MQKKRIPSLTVLNVSRGSVFGLVFSFVHKGGMFCVLLVMCLVFIMALRYNFCPWLNSEPPLALERGFVRISVWTNFSHGLSPRRLQFHPSPTCWLNTWTVFTMTSMFFSVIHAYIYHHYMSSLYWSQSYCPMFPVRWIAKYVRDKIFLYSPQRKTYELQTVL